MANELLTDYERKLQERDERMERQYAALREQYPTAANNRLFKIMAAKEKLTTASVRMRLLKRGVITVRKQGKNRNA